VSKIFLIRSYLNHWLRAVDEHSIHSPYFFDFYNKVIKNDAELPALNYIEVLRLKLLENQETVTIQDLGAKSSHFKDQRRKISSVARTSLSPSSICRLYYRIIHYTNSTNIIELGTSMGLTTLYLSHTNHLHVTTFEGNDAMVNIALSHFEHFDKKNITLVQGNLDTTLSEFLVKSERFQIAIMDANHRYEPTIRYVNLLLKRISEKGIIILDDIHYSQEMNKAWNEIKNHPLVYGSIDLFRCGIVFLDPALNRQHYIWSL
jgi:predicted O-methyltransferase YrrM